MWKSGYWQASRIGSPEGALRLLTFSILLSSIAFFASPASAQVQLPLIRGPAELSDEVLAAQLQGYIDPLRERLPLELRFAKTVCQLTDDQIAELKTAAEEEIETVSRQTAAALRDYAKGNGRRKAVSVNGKSITVPANFDEWLVAAPGSMMHQIVAGFIRSKWPESWQRFDAERERLSARRKRAAVLADVALIDEALLLTSKQRSELCRRLEATQPLPLRRPARVQPLVNPALEQLHAALASWELDAFPLPEADLATILRPAQFALMQELQQPQQQEMVIIQQAVPQQARAVAGAPANNRLLQIVIGADAGLVPPVDANPLMQVPAIRQEMQQRELAIGQVAARANVAVRRRVVRRGPSTADVQAQLARYVDRLIDEIDAACELTGPQQEKLRLAGKLDIEHWREESVPPAEALAPGEQLLVQQVQVKIAGPPSQIAIFHAAESAFQRACQNRLDDRQTQSLAAAQRDRREFQRRALIEAAVAGFERTAALTAEQCEELSAALDEALETPSAETSDNWRIECVRRIAELPADVLARILDDVQKQPAFEHQTHIAEALRQFEAQTAKIAAQRM